MSDSQAKESSEPQSNPGYIPGRLTFSDELNSMPMREFLAKRRANADAIRARWAEEDALERDVGSYEGFKILVGQMNPALKNISDALEYAMTA